jgi:hypothetical protein
VERVRWLVYGVGGDRAYDGTAVVVLSAISHEAPLRAVDVCPTDDEGVARHVDLCRHAVVEVDQDLLCTRGCCASLEAVDALLVGSLPGEA